MTTDIEVTACVNMGFTHYAHWEDDESRYHVWMRRDLSRDSVVHINSRDPNGRDHHTRKLSAKAQAWVRAKLDTVTPEMIAAADYRASAEGKAKAEELRVENLKLAARNLSDKLDGRPLSDAEEDCAGLLHKLAARLGYTVAPLPPEPSYQDPESITEAMADAMGPLKRFSVIVTRDVTESQSFHVYAADAEDARDVAVDLAECNPDAWAIDDGNAWDSGYVTDCTPDSPYVADFDPEARGAALTLFREGFDSGDPWGSAMGYAFDVAAALDLRGADVPPELHYRPGAFGSHVGEDNAETMATLGTESLVYAARVLSRYLDRCKRAGLDY